MSDQYLRAWNILVGTFTPGTNVFDETSSVLSLSSNQPGYDIHAHFQIRAPDVETPNTAEVRLWNLAPTTLNLLGGGPNAGAAACGEFTAIVIQAGYQTDGPAQIFAGNIKQVRTGRVSATDSYVDIFAGDGDAAYNYATVNQTLKNASPQDIAGAIGASFQQKNVSSGGLNLTGGILPRGKVLFGMARSFMRDLAKTTLTRWSIQDGKLVMVSLDGYAPGTAVQLNSYTGMVGVPESTPNGVTVRCLINPKIVVGGLVNINNGDIAQSTVKQVFGYPDYTGMTFLADTTADGFYKVLVHEIEGDTRGDSWYSDLTCLAVDRSAAQGSQVQPYAA